MSPSPPSTIIDASLICDAGAVNGLVREMAQRIVHGNPNLARVTLVGIPSRGLVVSRKLREQVLLLTGHSLDSGVIDVSMHRDDLRTRRGIWPVQPTKLPAELADRTLILVDDVLFSGRTVRAAMDAISSFGRPACIRLAVLVDRGHRELPIHADYVGRELFTTHGQRVYVRFEETDHQPDAIRMDARQP